MITYCILQVVQAQFDDISPNCQSSLHVFRRFGESKDDDKVAEVNLRKWRLFGASPCKLFDLF
jgi:hypothetical protein